MAHIQSAAEIVRMVIRYGMHARNHLTFDDKAHDISPAIEPDLHLLHENAAAVCWIVCDVNPDIFSRGHRKRTYRGCGAPAMRIGRNRKQRIGRIVTHNKNSPCKPFFLIYGTEVRLRVLTCHNFLLHTAALALLSGAAHAGTYNKAHHGKLQNKTYPFHHGIK